MPHLHRISCLLLASLLVACASESSSRKIENAAPDEYVAIRDEVPEPIGKFLADLDLSIRAWTNLTMTARSEEDERKARELAAVLERETNRRRDELVAELASGPARNRQRAAAALGFTGDPTVLGPLLAALEDRDPDVVHNAALGLALLGSAETPTETLTALLADHPDPQTRSMAAYALCSVVEAGADPTPLLPTVRMSLTDSAPGVRMQCALIAGMAGDPDSVQALADLLHDEQVLVRLAAIEALVQLGKRTGEVKGTAARALVDAWRDADRSMRSHLREGMVRLAGEDLGDEEERWVRWSRNLP